MLAEFDAATRSWVIHSIEEGVRSTEASCVRDICSPSSGGILVCIVLYEYNTSSCGFDMGLDMSLVYHSMHEMFL